MLYPYLKTKRQSKKISAVALKCKGFFKLADKQHRGEKTMDVLIGNNIPVILEDSGRRPRIPALKKMPRRDRRQNRQDRRKSIRDGVVVHISGREKERRSRARDRRKLTY